ncbi:hypothetical protein HHK36_003644 [Tetracentron sinense]|uniref:Uncharacterized protein n=1 Tax=Tetracentron sinense TaxID=13715 RepID=A0A834ZSV9_TETSI|nr:hypothetical protein HHK36_003644 [Tetracentron sinense]
MLMVSEYHFINLDSVAFEFFQLSTMLAAEKVALKKKLKMEVGTVRSATERIEVERGRRSCKLDRQVSYISESGQADSGKGKRKSEMNKVHNEMNHCLDDVKMLVGDKPKVKSVMLGANNRGPLGRLEDQREKKLRLDNGVIKQCAGILKKLMTHPTGWVFNQPVDPVALNIPDYFSVVTTPMDLGTIKSKLEKKLYWDIKDFAADVRLTFSNAMLYNPPVNNVHIMAKELNNIFNMRWKSVDAKWSGESPKVGQGRISNERQKKINNTRRGCNETSASRMNLLPKRSMSSEDKQKLRKDLVEISKKKMSPDLRGFLRRFDFISQDEERIEVDIDAFDEETLWELKRITRKYFDARAAEASSSPVEPSETANSCGCNFLPKDFHKGNRHACSSANTKPHTNLGTCISGSCGNITCRGSRHNDSIQPSSSDISSERSLGRDNNAYHDGAFNMVHLANGTPMVQMSKSDPDSDGAVSAVEEENVCHSSQFVTLATAAEEWTNPLYDDQLSPSKALRAAMLKNRFADTILKAQQKTLLDHGKKGDLVKLQQERERLERKQREEKARIEAQIRAAEAASRMRAEAKLKMQREREREAARIALQKMEKTVEIDENQAILKDLEMLDGCLVSDHVLNSEEFGNILGALDGGHLGKPLERLGLFMKDDNMEEDEVADLDGDGDGDVEEGEIGS